MALTFDLSKLTSRKVRSDIGTRIIKGIEGRIESKSDNEAINFLGWALGGLTSLSGFLLSKAGELFAFSWVKFWSWVTATRQFIWNFNWNATDEQLNTSIRAQWAAIGGQIGGTLGNTFGYLACGILPGMVIAAFNEPLGAVVLAKVGEEALEELLENLGALFNTALRLGTQILITETFKTARKLIKSNSKLVGKLLGKGAEKAIQAWGSKDSKPWSFALSNEETFNKRFGSDGFWREAVEEAQEEADEACIEAGYVVANAVDTYLSAQMLVREKTPILGHTRYVEITPNRENPDEKIVLGGSEELLKPQIIQVLSTYEQFNGRDLGVIYGTASADMPERRHRPEVVLKFYQKQNKNAGKGAIVDAVSMQIAFRLMDKSVKDFADDAYLQVLAGAIYREFATPPFTISKGLSTYTYADFEKGYQFKLDVINSTEAKRIIRKVQDIQGHLFRDECFRVGSRKITADGVIAPAPIKGEKVTVRGKVQELPIKGKEGMVKFTHAYLNLGINLPPIELVDVTGKRKNVVYKPATNTIN